MTGLPGVVYNKDYGVYFMAYPVILNKEIRYRSYWSTDGVDWREEPATEWNVPGDYPGIDKALSEMSYVYGLIAEDTLVSCIFNGNKFDIPCKPLTREDIVDYCFPEYGAFKRSVDEFTIVVTRCPNPRTVIGDDEVIPFGNMNIDCVVTSNA